MDGWKMKKWEKKHHHSNERPVTHNDMKIFIPFSVLLYCFCFCFGFDPHNFACKLFLSLELVHSVPVFRIVICFIVYFFHNLFFSLALSDTEKQNTTTERKRAMTSRQNERTLQMVCTYSKRQRCKRKIMSGANFYSCKFLSLLEEFTWQKPEGATKRRIGKSEQKCNGNYRK